MGNNRPQGTDSVRSRTKTQVQVLALGAFTAPTAHSSGVCRPCGPRDPAEGFCKPKLFRNKTKMSLYFTLMLTWEFSETVIGDEIIALYVYLGILMFSNALCELVMLLRAVMGF